MPSNGTRVYLDHNATSPLRPSSRQVMSEAIEGGQGNPASLHAEGRAARRLIETARAHVRMIRQYVLSPLEQTVHLFRPSSPDTLAEVSGQHLDQDLGWSSVLGQQLVLHTTSGEHFSTSCGA